jgi:hypothetical protein
MKAKKEYIVLIVVILALGLYLFFRTPDRSQYQLPRLPEVDAATITKVEIDKPDTSIVIEKEGDEWHLVPKGYLADNNRVKTMLETIQGLTVTALVSESKSYGRYDMGDDKKITVKAWIGDKLAREFDLGKAAASFRHTFVKWPGDGRVYHARGNFRATFDQNVDSLRDKLVLSFDQAGIEEIRIIQDKQELVLVRTQLPVEVTDGPDEAESKSPEQRVPEFVWQTADGRQGDKTTLSRLMTTLSSLRCEKYIDDKSKADFTNPIYAVRLKGSQEFSLSLFAKTDEKAKDYPAVSSGSDYPFFLSDWQVGNVMKKPEEILKKSDKS